MKKLLFLMLFVGTVYADPLAVEEIQTPLGGLNTHDPSWRISSKYSPYMRNVFIDNGRIDGVGGYQTLGSTRTLSKVTGIFPYRRENGNTTFLVTDSSVTLETADSKTYTFVSSASNTGSLLNWLQVRNKMWGYNGIDFVKVYDGITTAILNGNNNTPNVPKFKYGQYWQERVWGFNNPSIASELAFSSVVTTDAVIINPDDSRAWPVTNSLKIGQGDGEVGTALWVKDAQLKVGKERSKYTIYGTNVSNYFARKDISNSVGVISNDSVVNLDNGTYYLSQEGIYKDEDRISDLIEPDIETFSRGVQKNLSNIWDTQADFLRGDFSGSTTTVSGFLTINPTSFQVNYDTSPLMTTGGAYSFPNGAFATDYAVFSPTNTPPTYFLGFPRNSNPTIIAAQAMKIYAKCSCTGGTGDAGLSLAGEFKNLRTGNVNSFGSNPGLINDGNFHPIQFYASETQSPIFSADDIIKGNMTIKLSGTFTQNTPGDKFTLYGATTIGFSDVNLKFATTGQFVSDVATLTSVTAWGNFDSVRNTNGGNITYFTRASTSIVNIATQTWLAISPGAVVNQPIINNYIQWASTLASVSSFTANSPSIQASNIDLVQIDHIEGSGSLNRAFGIDWKNRYWLATSTDGGDTFSLIYVKSKVTNEVPNAFMPIQGINIRCFAKDGNNLYGGSSSTGAIYRLDYGTNYDGRPIDYIYDTPDMTLGSNWTSKNSQNYLLDANKDTSLNLNVGTSIDFAPFSNRVIPLNGPGRSLTVIKGITNPAKTLRVRLSHSLLDKQFVINNFSVLYSPTAILEPK